MIGYSYFIIVCYGLCKNNVLGLPKIVFFLILQVISRYLGLFATLISIYSGILYGPSSVILYLLIVKIIYYNKKVQTKNIKIQLVHIKNQQINI